MWSGWIEFNAVGKHEARRTAQRRRGAIATIWCTGPQVSPHFLRSSYAPDSRLNNFVEIREPLCWPQFLVGRAREAAPSRFRLKPGAALLRCAVWHVDIVKTGAIDAQVDNGVPSTAREAREI
jgi:hypothetical protein